MSATVERTATVVLRGMTWDHPRGYDPLVACSREWERTTGVRITWERRSLQAFESQPVAELAARYDLIVIDHPHVGRISSEHCLLPFDRPERAAALAEIRAGSVGPSFASYHWAGRQWALPIDAATQVQAWRPDLLDAPVTRWEEVVGLARQGAVQCPLRPPHSLMVFYTLAANLGRPCAAGPERRLVDPESGREVWERMRELFAHIDPACLGMDPIAVFERMASADGDVAVVPLIYGYISYAREGFRPRRIAFADMPALGRTGPTGSALGGTGIAVSARTQHPERALDFAFWVASGEVQRALYTRAGGQPAHAAAWDDVTLDEEVGGFFRCTRATLEGAWVRPQHPGYMRFQGPAAERINEGLSGGEPADAVLRDLNRMFRKSFD